MSVEEKLRSWGAAERAAAEPVRVPVERFRRHRGSRVVAMLAAAAVVVAAAVTLVVIRDSHESHQGTAPLLQRPKPAPPGYRNVTFHGLTVTVPASWVVGKIPCSTPTVNMVWNSDGAMFTCDAVRPLGVTDVRFYTVQKPTAGATTIRIGKTVASRSETVKHGLHSVTIEVPSLAAGMTVTSASMATIDRLVAASQISSADANGCASHEPDLRIDAKYSGGSPDLMVPGHPTSLVACGYLFSYLEKSKVDNPSRAQTILNALPSGLSRSAVSGSTCWDHTDSFNGDSDDAATTVLRFGYADGRVVSIRARLGYCGLVGATNGLRTAQRLQSLVDLINDSGVSGGIYKATVRPAR